MTDWNPMRQDYGDELQRHVDQRDEAHAVMYEQLREVRTENARLIAALNRRNERPTDEKLANLLDRATKSKKHKTWRIVAYLIRCLQAERARTDESAAVLHEMVNVRGDFYEPHPLALMVERLADHLAVDLQPDWKCYLTRDSRGV